MRTVHGVLGSAGIQATLTPQRRGEQPLRTGLRVRGGKGRRRWEGGRERAGPARAPSPSCLQIPGRTGSRAVCLLKVNIIWYLERQNLFWQLMAVFPKPQEAARPCECTNAVERLNLGQ